MDEDTDAKAAQDQMDFSGWNSDLESSFLDTSGNDNNWDETMNEWKELTTFPGGSDTEGKAGKDAKEGGNVGARGIAESENVSLPSSSTKDGIASVTESSDRSSEAKQSMVAAAEPMESRLHPQAIQSSAMCPPHGKILPPNYEDVYPTPSPQVNAAANLYAVSLGRVAAAASNAAASTSALIPNVLQGSLAYQNQTLSSLAANYQLAQSTSTGRQTAIPTVSTEQSSNPQHQSALQYVAAASSSGGNSGSSSASSSQKKAPPFLLFDSPVELRANFNQNQRRLGMPVKHDCNSYHYGEAVKGFHPQHLVTTKDGIISHQQRLQKTSVQLIDGRHAPPVSAGRIKNEREQKRAQKITELIDQLGGIMKEGGWNIATKSKYQVLSSCTEYMKHLIKMKEEKELAVNKLKKEVEEKKRRMEEDTTAQEGRSDPESVTSSLTSSTTGSSRLNPKMPSSPSGKKQKGRHHRHHRHHRGQAPTKHHHKKDQMISRNMSSVSTNEDSSGGGSRTNGGGPKDQTFSVDKTAVSGVSDLTDSNRGSSSNNSGSGGSGSNGTRTGSAGSGSGGSTLPTPEPSPQDRSAADEPSTSSISSDAAVASEQSSRDRHNESPQHHHKDVVFNKRKRKDRMKPPEAVTSLEGSFKLDYEEVFDQSNIPQLIAGTSGKIVSWNQSFVNATGLEEADLERMTIFSLVQPDKLSSFFEIAARALRSNDEEAEVSNDSSKENHHHFTTTTTTTMDDSQQPQQQSCDNSSTTTTTTQNQRKWNYAAMTLPCIEFPAMKERRESSKEWENIEKLNVTMILITDPNPHKRCFHCTFTDCPGTNGTLGIVTPDLLAALYSNPEKLNLEQHTHYRRKHKRAKLTATKQKGNALQASRAPKKPST